MFKFIQNWRDKRLKKRLERMFNNNVLDCNISITGLYKDDIKPNKSSYVGGNIEEDTHKNTEKEMTYK